MKNNDEVDDQIFKKKDFAGNDLKRLRVGSSTFEGCVFNNTDFSSSGFVGVTFSNCSLVGTQFFMSFFRDCKFIDCKFDITSFFGTTHKNSQFKSCEMKEVDLNQSKIKKLKFETCVLDGVNFSGLEKPEGIDLRTSTIVKIDGFDSLKGATISPEQLINLAPLMAQSLGIKVKE